jgi:hypothetical protein
VIPCSRRTHFTPCPIPTAPDRGRHVLLGDGGVRARRSPGSLAQIPAGLHRTRVSEMRVSRARGAAPSMLVGTPSAHPSFSTPGHGMALSTATG